MIVKAPIWIRWTMIVVGLAYVTVWLMFYLPWGLWLLIPGLYYSLTIFGKWLRSKWRWRKVKKTTELDDIDKEWELYNR